MIRTDLDLVCFSDRMRGHVSLLFLLLMMLLGIAVKPNEAFLTFIIPSLVVHKQQQRMSMSARRRRIIPLFLSDNDKNDETKSIGTSVDAATSTPTTTTNTRWRGNFKPSIQTLSDISKAKKHEITVTVQNVTKVLYKKKYESLQHVLVKAILWKLYCHDYSNIQIELDIGDPSYLPDVVAFDKRCSSSTLDGFYDATNATAIVSSFQQQQQQKSPPQPLFWGESGRMTLQKARELCVRYPTTHIVWMRWGISIQDFVQQAAPALQPVANMQNRPHGRFTLAAISNRNVWEYFGDHDGGTTTSTSGHGVVVTIDKENVEWYEMHDYVK